VTHNLAEAMEGVDLSVERRVIEAFDPSPEIPPVNLVDP